MALATLTAIVTMLGLFLSGHPAALVRPRQPGAVPVARAVERPGAHVRVVGVLAASRRTPTRKGDTMQFVTLEDETGLLECTLFPRVWKRHAALTARGIGYRFDTEPKS